MNQPANEPFASLAALRSANRQLGEQRRSEGESPALQRAIADFLLRGRALGALLAETDDRWSAQSLLDYWAAILERSGATPPDATLAEFDPQLAPELPDEDCPYLGLEAFNEQQAQRFFGRRRVVDELLERLAKCRLVAIVGPSGSGKSSLVRAGLLPALRAGQLAGSETWQLLPPIVPGSAPDQALEYALATITTDDVQHPCLLLIDQFEEVFTLCSDPASQNAFFARMLQLVEHERISHRVILTMRSDFESYMTRITALYLYYEAGKLSIPPLTASELRDAIEQPAAQVGLIFETGVVDALLGEVLGEPAALPLLQYSLLKLWEARERNRVTWAAYQQIGGGRLALKRGADAVYEQLIPEDQKSAQRIFLRLVRPGEGLEITSKRVRRAELAQGGEDPSRVERVLTRLVDARLLRLTSGDTGDDAQVEIAHEALIRNWPILADWLEDERHNLRERQRLSERAEQWQRLGHTKEDLLQGQLLEEAQRYPDLSPLEREFVQASAAAVAARLRQAQRTSWLIRILLLITTVTSIIASLLFLQTYQSRAIIDSQRLAFVAQSQLDEQPELGLLLAYEAHSRDDNLATRQALRDAVAATTWRSTPLVGHTGRVHSAVFSPDGSRILTASFDGTARVWDTQGQLLVNIAGHTRAVSSATFSPDDQQVLTASWDGTARLWDRAGKPIATLEGHEQAVHSAVFSPDGQRILTASDDQTARLWSSAGELLTTLNGHTGAVLSALFSPDGQHVLTASADGTARLWDASGNFITTMKKHNRAVVKAVFSNDGRYFVTASFDNTACLWNQDGNYITTLEGHSRAIKNVVFSSDNNFFITISEDNTARVWNMRGDLIVILTDHKSPLSSGMFSSDGQRILTASWDGTARLWDSTGHPLFTLTGHLGEVNSAIFSPDDQRILTASGDGTARLWEINEQPLASLHGHTAAVNGAVYSPDGQHILTVSNDSSVRLWDLTGSTQLTLTDHFAPVYMPTFSPDGQRMLTASLDKTARLWDINGEPLAVLEGHSSTVREAIFSPDGKRLLTASLDGTARLWDNQGNLIRVLDGHANAVMNVAFDLNGQRILTASLDRTARLWDSNGDLLFTLEGHNGWVNNVIFSSDDQHIITTSDDSTARIWDSQGRLVAILQGHASEVRSATFSPDAQRILTASLDGTARLWDSRGQSLATLTGHTSWVYSANFSPDGHYILTASADGTARLWTHEGHALAVLRGHSGEVYSAVFSPDSTRILTASADGTARQYMVTTEDLRRAAVCRVNRGLTPEEVQGFEVALPLAFDTAQRQCPPVYSWER